MVKPYLSNSQYGLISKLTDSYIYSGLKLYRYVFKKQDLLPFNKSICQLAFLHNDKARQKDQFNVKYPKILFKFSKYFFLYLKCYAKFNLFAILQVCTLLLQALESLQVSLHHDACNHAQSSSQLSSRSSSS